MRLTPADKPKPWWLKLAFYISKKQFGKVIAPLRFIYARSKPVMMASFKIITTDRKLHLAKETKLLIRYFTSNFNECKFCSNLTSYVAQKENVEFQKLSDIMNHRSSAALSSKEKSLLAYIEEVNLTKTVSDETFEDLKKHFTEQEIVEITWINASENYFNLMAKPLGLTSDELIYKINI